MINSFILSSYYIQPGPVDAGVTTSGYRRDGPEAGGAARADGVPGFLLRLTTASEGAPDLLLALPSSTLP